MSTPIPILMFAENPNDAILVSNELLRHGVHATVTLAVGNADGETRTQYAVIIANNTLSWAVPKALLVSIRERWARSPVVLLLEESKDREAGELLRQGLVDFVIRPRTDLSNLIAVIWTALNSTLERGPGWRGGGIRNDRLEQPIAGFFRCFHDGRLFDLNLTLARMLGFDERAPSILAGHALWDGAAPAQFLRTGVASPADFQIRLRRIDSKPCWGRLIAWPLATSSGQTVAYEGWVEDMTQCHLCHAALREGSAIHRAVLETVGTAIGVMDEKGTLVLVNAEFERMSGYTRQELLGKISGHSFVAPDEMKRVERTHTMQISQKGGRPVSYERKFVNRNGETRHTQVTVRPVAGTRRIVESIVDITEERRVERSMKLLADGLAQQGDDIFMRLAASLAETLNIEYALIAEAAGQPPDSLRLLGTAGFGSLRSPSESPLAGSVWAELILGRRLFSTCTGNARRVHPEDNWLKEAEAESFIGLPLIARDGRRIGVVVIFSRRPLEGIRTHKYAMQLIARRAAAELERWRSLEKIFAFSIEEVDPGLGDVTGQNSATNLPRLLSTALDQTADHVMITDSRGTIFYVNRAFTLQTGYGREEVIGRTPRLLKSGQHPAEFYAAMWERLRAGEVFKAEFANRRKEGGLFWEAKTITPVRNRLGEVAYFVSTGRDITEQKKTEEQMRHTQRLEAVGRLAGGVAHDFNNLLTAIMGFSSLALTSLSPGQSARDDIEQIRRAGERAATLTRQLLAFSRRQILNAEVLDPNEVLLSLEQMLRRLIPETIELRVWLTPEVGRIKADRDQIELAIVNLVVNARDAMPAGGSLTLRTDSLPPTGGTIAPFTANSCIHISISDTGSGMDADTKRHIFEPFFTTKPVEKGTGLGLATVYGIITQSGGAIAVDTELGRGTTFHLYLPQVNEPLAVTVAKSDSVPKGGSETLLVVEDADAVRQFAVRALRERGYTVYEAENGVAALTLMRAAFAPKIDLLVTDVVMPHCDGVELVAALRQLQPRLPVLFISGYAESELGKFGLQPWEVQFLHKPFEPDALVGKIHHTLTVYRERTIAESRDKKQVRADLT